MQPILSRKPTPREIDVVVTAAFNVAHDLSIAKFASLLAFSERFSPLSNLIDVAPHNYRDRLEQAVRIGNIYASGNNRIAYEAARKALAGMLGAMDHD